MFKAVITLSIIGTLAAVGYFMSMPSDNPLAVTYEFAPCACLSVYGLETPLRDTICSWKHPGAYYIEQARKLGFNTIRIPVAIQYLAEGNLGILDQLVAACTQYNMRFLLDFHRVRNTRQEESWDVGIQEYGISREKMRDIMVSVIARYEAVPQFAGMNSWNEYTGTNVTYKVEWDRFIFDHLETIFPDRFVYLPTGLFWGNDLAGYSLKDTPYVDRVVYSVHKYPFSGTGNRQDWDKTFGFLPPLKVFVEEYGFSDLNWGREFVNYLLEKGIRNHCFWTVAHSGDTGGLWEDDCETLNTRKLEIIKPILLPT